MGAVIYLHLTEKKQYYFIKIEYFIIKSRSEMDVIFLQ